jgi:uncharacterized protein (TIGR03382 family)
MTHGARLSWFALLALAPLWPAHASRQFPDQIRSDLTLPYTPQCSLCHLEGKTGTGAAFTPFAFSARARGLVAGGGGRGNTVSTDISTTLAKMDTDKVDSDGDGVSDIDELKAGTDPNVYGPVPIPLVEPTYGCQAAGLAGLFPLALAALFLARLRRASSGGSSA